MAEAPLTRVTPELRVREFKSHTAITDLITTNTIEPEDVFKNFMVSNGSQCLPSTYDMTQLENLVQNNNALGSCIDAMEANIDGTGAVIEPIPTREEDAIDSNGNPLDSNNPKFVAERKLLLDRALKIEGFFSEPWPGVSFTTIRRELRRDQEVTGNAYLEVLRNPAGQMLFLRRIPPKDIRLCKLTAPIATDVKVVRGGRDVSVKVGLRYRRYAQVIGNALVYFKEFGAPIDLNKVSGDWEDAGKRLPAVQRASEIIHFILKPDPHTPYGLPRWVAQIPSVLGSRKAEEQNLEFFDAGGVPPVLIAVSGGELAPEAAERIEQLMSAQSKTKSRAAVIEAFSSDGTLDSTSNVKIQVERFDSAQSHDSTFEVYDQRCEERVRRSFRLPPLFVGKADGFAFAAVFASYTVAEAQVFQTERQEFDEIVNNKLLPELDSEGILYRSLPLSVKHAETQMAALEIAVSSGAISNEQLVTSLNEISSLSLKLKEGADSQPDAPIDPAADPPPGSTPVGGPKNPDAAGNARPDVQKDDD